MIGKTNLALTLINKKQKTKTKQSKELIMFSPNIREENAYNFIPLNYIKAKKRTFLFYQRQRTLDKIRAQIRRSKTLTRRSNIKEIIFADHKINNWKKGSHKFVNVTLCKAIYFNVYYNT